MVESYDLWQALANMIWAFVGALVGSIVSFKVMGNYYGKAMAKGYQEKMHDYLKKEEEALNEKIQRSKF